GVVGEDGPTHIGAYDISFLRCIPNMTIATPSDELECRLLLSTCYQQDTPSAVRYPRGTGPGVTVNNELDTLPIGKGIIRKKGKKIAILAFGTILQSAIPVAKSLNATLVDMRFVKPIDETLIIKLAKEHEYLVTLEENTIQGGAGSAVLEVLAKNKNCTPVLTLGIPDEITEHGNAKLILQDLGLDSDGIQKSIQ
ncbi:MAG: 1-deoxy-D-xylulose-5-phosphate synthase, partial [Neisseriaceae bacterium]|nr:1-deoxy-D-xylulose-5-phosphate synthase [Neisseriaceae bacterium]